MQDYKFMKRDWPRRPAPINQVPIAEIPLYHPKRLERQGVRLGSKHERDALNKPHSSQRTDAVRDGRSCPRPLELQNHVEESLQSEDGNNEQHLSCLDTQIEGQQRKSHVRLRQSNFLKRPPEAKAMKQAEGKTAK